MLDKMQSSADDQESSSWTVVSDTWRTVNGEIDTFISNGTKIINDIIPLYDPYTEEIKPDVFIPLTENNDNLGSHSNLKTEFKNVNEEDLVDDMEIPNGHHKLLDTFFEYSALHLLDRLWAVESFDRRVLEQRIGEKDLIITPWVESIRESKDDNEQPVYTRKLDALHPIPFLSWLPLPAFASASRIETITYDNKHKIVYCVEKGVIKDIPFHSTIDVLLTWKLKEECVVDTAGKSSIRTRIIVSCNFVFHQYSYIQSIIVSSSLIELRNFFVVWLEESKIELNSNQDNTYVNATRVFKGISLLLQNQESQGDTNSENVLNNTSIPTPIPLPTSIPLPPATLPTSDAVTLPTTSSTTSFDTHYPIRQWSSFIGEDSQKSNDPFQRFKKSLQSTTKQTFKTETDDEQYYTTPQSMKSPSFDIMVNNEVADNENKKQQTNSDESILDIFSFSNITSLFDMNTTTSSSTQQGLNSSSHHTYNANKITDHNRHIDIVDSPGVQTQDRSTFFSTLPTISLSFNDLTKIE